MTHLKSARRGIGRLGFSGRINGFRLRQNLVADGGLQTELGDEIYFPAQHRRKLGGKRAQRKETDMRVGLELNEEVDVASFFEVWPESRAENSQLTDLVAQADLGDLGHRQLQVIRHAHSIFSDSFSQEPIGMGAIMQSIGSVLDKRAGSGLILAKNLHDGPVAGRPKV